MDRQACRWARAIPAPRLTTLLWLVALAALISALAAQNWRSSLREARLQDELRAERARAQGYFRLVRLATYRYRRNRPAVVDHALAAEMARETERFRREAARLRTGVADSGRRGNR